MDITPWIGPIITIVLALLGFYAAISSRLTKLETQVEVLVKLTDQHSHLIERTTQLESEMKTVFKRIDELQEYYRKIDEKLDKISVKVGVTHD